MGECTHGSGRRRLAATPASLVVASSPLPEAPAPPEGPDHVSCRCPSPRPLALAVAALLAGAPWPPGRDRAPPISTRCTSPPRRSRARRWVPRPSPPGHRRARRPTTSPNCCAHAGRQPDRQQRLGPVRQQPPDRPAWHGPGKHTYPVDGKRVGARCRAHSAAASNTRGDTNWVPAEMIHASKCCAAAAAARYGSVLPAAWSTSSPSTRPAICRCGRPVAGLVPEHSAEGAAARRPAAQRADDRYLSFRMYGNLNRTDADSLDLNRRYATNPNAVPPAGREGVKNRDVNALRWDVTANQVVEFEAGTSRQGNITPATAPSAPPVPRPASIWRHWPRAKRDQPHVPQHRCGHPPRPLG